MAGLVGLAEVQERDAAVAARSRSRRTALTRAASCSSLIVTRSSPSGHERWNSENFVLVAKSAVLRPASWATLKSDSTG